MLSPSLSRSSTATCALMYPFALRRCIRRQHGDCDSPTRSAISLEDSDASTCRRSRILRSRRSSSLVMVMLRIPGERIIHAPALESGEPSGKFCRGGRNRFGEGGSMDRNDLTIIDAAEVRRRLDYPSCIEAMREAMRALSAGTTRQLLRTMIPLGEARTFAQMPGALGTHDMFGAKLVSVFGDPAAPGRRRHRGVIVLFEPDDGKPVAI